MSLHLRAIHLIRKYSNPLTRKRAIVYFDLKNI